MDENALPGRVRRMLSVRSRFLHPTRFALSKLIKKSPLSIIADSRSIRLFFPDVLVTGLAELLFCDLAGVLLGWLLASVWTDAFSGLFHFLQDRHILVEIAAAKINTGNIQSHHEKCNDIASDHVD